MIVSIQLLRFLAAILVAYTHYAGHEAFVGIKFGGFGVDIFFVISGYVISLIVSRQKNHESFLARRFIRIVPLYWIVTLILYIGIVISPSLASENLLKTTTLTNLLYSLVFLPNPEYARFLPVLSLGWTLNLELLFYCIVYLSLLSRFPRPFYYLVS
jgi:peptidoglycan/LPS O-acetylase OafA/YrhL